MSSTIYTINGDEIPNPFVEAKLIGINYPNADYIARTLPRGHKDYVMSRSELLIFLQCPQRWIQGYQKPESSAMDFGSILDTAWMSKEKFDELFYVTPDTYPAPAHHQKVKKGEINEGDPLEWNGASTYCKLWEAENARGRRKCSAEDRQGANAAIDALTRDPLVSEVFQLSLKQVRIDAVYVDEETGVRVPVKTLIDLAACLQFHDGAETWDGRTKPALRDHSFFRNKLCDYKTCRSATHRAWTRHVRDFGYDVQAAFFSDVFMALYPALKSIEWLFIIQESFPPFSVGRRILGMEYMELGRQIYLKALRLYCKCLKENCWYGYDDAGNTINGWSIVRPEVWMLSHEIDELPA